MKGLRILMSAQFDNYSPRKDGSFSLRFVTGEKMPSEVMDLHALMGNLGYLYFRAEEQLTKEEIKELDDLDTEMGETKTKSQRLRSTLYRYWEQDDKGHKEFKDFYSNWMESIITKVKDKLEPR